MNATRLPSPPYTRTRSTTVKVTPPYARLRWTPAIETKGDTRTRQRLNETSNVWRVGKVHPTAQRHKTLEEPLTTNNIYVCARRTPEIECLFAHIRCESNRRWYAPAVACHHGVGPLKIATDRPHPVGALQDTGAKMVVNNIGKPCVQSF